MNNDDFYQKANDAVIFETSNKGYTTINEYIERNNNTKTIIYSSNKEIQGNYIDILTSQGKEVILLDNMIDSHFKIFRNEKF